MAMVKARLLKPPSTPQKNYTLTSTYSHLKCKIGSQAPIVLYSIVNSPHLYIFLLGGFGVYPTTPKQNANELFTNDTNLLSVCLLHSLFFSQTPPFLLFALVFRKRIFLRIFFSPTLVHPWTFGPQPWPQQKKTTRATTGSIPRGLPLFGLRSQQPLMCMCEGVCGSVTSWRGCWALSLVVVKPTRNT